MATVSNPATLSSIKAVFGGTGKLSDYVKGGAYVSSSNPAPISTTVAGLRLSQFNGASASVALTATVSPTSVSGSYGGPTGSVGSATSNSAAVSPAGGTPPYTYAWTYVSGQVMTANTSTSQATTFSYSHQVPSVTVGSISFTGYYNCVVTDSLGATVSTTNETVQLFFVNTT